MIKNIHNWDGFVKELSKSILPLYQHHENTFDKYGIHGRLHICRSIIFSEFMTRFLSKEFGQKLDFNAIRYAVAFHDSGRQANGIDFWEQDSSDNCYSYLSKNFEEGYSKYVSNLIVKRLNNSDKNKIIVIDSDVLDIMRPCGHGGREGFNPNFLSFLKDSIFFEDVRDNLIEDAWKLIEYTEDNKHLFDSKTNNHLYLMMDMIENNKGDYELLGDF